MGIEPCTSESEGTPRSRRHVERVLAGVESIAGRAFGFLQLQINCNTDRRRRQVVAWTTAFVDALRLKGAAGRRGSPRGLARRGLRTGSHRRILPRATRSMIPAESGM